MIAFGLAKWEEMESDPRFRSVIYFRNFGPTSGGSQRHPHSQIIGLMDYDYRDNLQGENFLGEVIYENDDCYASLAEYPLSGVGELNVTLKKEGASDGFADTIQTLARYVLSDFPIRCSSYNIFLLSSEKSDPRQDFPPLHGKPSLHGLPHHECDGRNEQEADHQDAAI